jgi:Na+-transporting NADH:ubiquinone oxidoreductase subunit B/electron transport complex protein RnfD
MDLKIAKKSTLIASIQDAFRQLFIDRNLVYLSGALLLLMFYRVVTPFPSFHVEILYIFLSAVLGGLLVELTFAKFRKRKIDPAWLYTPLLMTMLLPITIVHPINGSFLFWMPAVGAIVASLYGKLVFGGHKKYVFNPSVVGIIFLSVSFALIVAAPGNIAGLLKNHTVTPFTLTYLELLMGPTNGYIGDSFRLGIIVLGLGLAYLKSIDLKITFAYLGAVMLLTFLGQMYVDGTQFALWEYSTLVGTVMFAAFFILPDPYTSPNTTVGKIVYGVFAGLITVLIRTYTSSIEGVIYAVILSNAFAPLIDSMVNLKPIPALIKGVK